MRRMCLVEREEERKRMQKWRVVCLDGWRRREYAKEKVEGLKDSVEGAERKGGGIGGTEEQGRVGMAEKLKESEKRRRERNRGIRG